MTKPAAALVLACLLAAPGCAALDRVEDALNATGAFAIPRRLDRPGCAVTLRAGARQGRGLIVGPRTVLTVAHVVGDERSVDVAASALCWATARVARRVPAAPEDLVELEVQLGAGPFGFAGFEAERVAAQGDGAPAFVCSGSELHAWPGAAPGARALRPGDSGSPVLDAAGAAVGLVVGQTADGEGVMSPLPARQAARGLVLAAR